MRVLRSYPEDKLDLRPHPNCKTARELAWVFVLERGLGKTVQFLTAPKTLGDVRRLDFAWFMLCDQIHHRGQFSVYLRMADAKVPSIYGPSADEPWM